MFSDGIKISEALHPLGPTASGFAIDQTTEDKQRTAIRCRRQDGRNYYKQDGQHDYKG